jgi:hypothetical protein
MDIGAVPILGGVVGLVANPEDMKAKAFWLLGGLLIIALVFESLGYSLGVLGQQVIGAFPLLMVYIIGQKQGEQVVG